MGKMREFAEGIREVTRDRKYDPTVPDKTLSGPSEEVTQMVHTVLTREDTRRETDALFVNAPASRRMNRGEVEKLFVQGKGAQTMSPDLQKTASCRTEAFFDGQEYLTEAQRLFPELLQVAGS
jgi:hypothetical protein